MTTDTPTLIAAMRILSREIQSSDGVANLAIAEAADRLEELQSSLRQIVKHQKIIGGPAAGHSVVVLIAERALNHE